MPEGVIVGGWSYVIGAYGITAAVLLAYNWSLNRRLNRLRRLVETRLESERGASR